MSAHTKGPWAVKRDGHYVLVEGADGTGLFFETDRHTGALADARLIAAAPKLLKELRRARRLLVAEGYIPTATMDAAIAEALGTDEPIPGSDDLEELE